MNVKTVTGATLQMALQEARRLFGDHVVLLESIAPSQGQPARITVLADDRTPAAVSAQAPALVAADGGSNTLAGSRFDARDDQEDAYPALPLATRVAQNNPTQNPRGRFYPAPEPRRTAAAIAPAAPVAPAPAAIAPQQNTAMVTTQIERMLETFVQRMHARIEALEERLERQAPAPLHRFSPHPLFAGLVQSGMSPEMALPLFDSLLTQGLGPDADEMTIRWGLAAELRRRLECTSPHRAVGTQVFIGHSGAGKTSLILRLATHPGYYGRRRPAVLVVGPEERTGEVAVHGRTEMYTQFGVPAMRVSTPEEMADAVDRLQRFDQLLIDTPPLPRRPDQQKRAMLSLREILEPVMPLQTTAVFSATSALDGLSGAALDRWLIPPDAIALTHVDEVMGWGRVAEWLLRLQKPVRYATVGPQVPHDIVAYNPAWFVEEMLPTS